MSKRSKLFWLGVLGGPILGFAMGFASANIAISAQRTSDGFSLGNHANANFDAGSKISFFCVRNDDLVEVSMDRSMARKREGRWYLPGYSECF